MSQEAWIELSDLKEKEAINQSTNQPMEKGRKREAKKQTTRDWNDNLGADPKSFKNVEMSNWSERGQQNLKMGIEQRKEEEAEW